MVVTIHQPEHLPWLGFFEKAAHADTLVLLDHVPFRKNYFQNRNRVRTAQGCAWLTVPVRAAGRTQPLNEVRVANASNPRWAEKHWRTLNQCYGGTPHFSPHAPFLRDHYQRRWSLLSEVNQALIEYLIAQFAIEARVVRSSDLACPDTDRTGQLVQICLRLGADTYLSGISGREYLDPEAFDDAGIELRFQRFRHPVYEQRYEPFLPCMSAVDLLFNHGPRSREILRGIGTECLDVVFE